MEGWIKIHRKILEWEWFSNSQMTHLFLYFLLKANYESGTYRGSVIKRGELVFGRKRVSIELNISEQSLRTALKRLKSTKEITTKSTKEYTVISICNYDDYNPLKENDQPRHQPSNQLTTNPTTNQQLTTQLTTCKEVKKKEVKKKETTNPQSPPKNNNIFDTLRKNYPATRRGDKKQCLKKFKEQEKVLSAEQIYDAVKNYVLAYRAEKTVNGLIDWKYLKQLPAFLNTDLATWLYPGQHPDGEFKLSDYEQQQLVVSATQQVKYPTADERRIENNRRVFEKSLEDIENGKFGRTEEENDSGFFSQLHRELPDSDHRSVESDLDY